MASKPIRPDGFTVKNFIEIEGILVEDGLLWYAMIVDQMAHSAKSKILHHLVAKKIMGKAQFYSTNFIQFLQVLVIKHKVHAGQIIFKLG